MTTRAPQRPLDELLCSDCRTGIPAFVVDGTRRRVCHRCVSSAVTQADAAPFLEEIDVLLRAADEAIQRRLRAIRGDEDCVA